MKKILALLLMVVMSFTILTGCGNPLYDDFENFLNVEMTEVNENYEKIKEEAGKWGELQEYADFEASINGVLLPLVEDSLVKLENINPATEEVKEIKGIYVKMMEAYQDGFSVVLVGLQEQDANKMNEGNEKITEALALLEEYNSALEALAAELGSEIEY